MAKLNVTVDNGLDDVKLESTDKLKSKKSKQKVEKNKKETKEKKSYISQIRSELKQVTWPSRKNVVKYSISTVLMIAFLAAFFIGLSALFDLLYGLVQGWIG